MSQGRAAVAERVSERPADGGRSTELRPQPRRYRLGSVHLVQLLVLEAVLLAVLIVGGRAGLIPVLVAGLVAVLATGVALRRRQGRWLFEWRVLRRRFRRRRRQGQVVEHADPRLTALRSLARGLTVTELTASDGTSMGIAADDAGWFAVIEGQSSAGSTALAPDVAPGPPLERLVRQIVESQVLGVTVQVVTHTVPVPAPHLDPQCAAVRSYRELAPAIGGSTVPMAAVTWVVLRLDAVALAAQAESAELSPPAVLMTLIRRTAGALRRSGAGWRVLDREGLLAALARSSDLEPVASAAAVVPVEEWTHWRSAGLDHATFWVQQWPAVESPLALLDLLAGVPTGFSSLAVIAVPEQDQVAVRALIRVAAPAGQLAEVSAALVAAAGQVRAQLQRLDGEHAPAVYASAPTGGGFG